jgi:hypothetical protein
MDPPKTPTIPDISRLFISPLKKPLNGLVYRKSHHEVRHRQEFFPLLVDPQAGQVVLAARAISVATGKRPPLAMMTVGALGMEFACGRVRQRRIAAKALRWSGRSVAL